MSKYIEPQPPTGGMVIQQAIKNDVVISFPARVGASPYFRQDTDGSFACYSVGPWNRAPDGVLLICPRRLDNVSREELESMITDSRVVETIPVEDSPFGNPHSMVYRYE